MTSFQVSKVLQQKEVSWVFRHCRCWMENRLPCFPLCCGVSSQQTHNYHCDSYVVCLLWQHTQVFKKLGGGIVGDAPVSALGCTRALSGASYQETARSAPSCGKPPLFPASTATNLSIKDLRSECTMIPSTRRAAGSWWSLRPHSSVVVSLLSAAAPAALTQHFRQPPIPARNAWHNSFPGAHSE